MCGRYLVDDEVYADMWMLLNNGFGTHSSQLSVDERLTAAENAPGVPSAAAQNPARGEVFPTNIAPVITHDGAVAVKWGFPHWKRSGVVINARAETALDKYMFRKPLLERRCVIPSSGFYEWSHGSGGKAKDKYLLREPGERMLFMAGIVSTFTDSDGSRYDAFVILTTAANTSVAPIHDRMPVILAPNEMGSWITDAGFMQHALHRTGPGLLPEIC